MRRGVGLGIVAALVVSAGPARATEPAAAVRPTAVLEFARTSTEASCPTERDFRDHVIGRLGFDPFVARAPRTLVVTLRDDKKKVRAEVVLRGDAILGRRELEANRSECGELGDSVAIAVSMILDPLGTASSSPPAPAPAPAPEPPKAPSPPLVPTPPKAGAERSPPAEAPRRFTPSFALAPQVSFGRGPSVTAGGRIDAFAWSGAWAVGLEGMVESTAGFVDAGTERARTLFASGGALACHRWPWIEGCGLASIGVAQGEVEALAPVRRTLVSWAGVRVGVPSCSGARVCVEPTVDLLVNVVRTRFHADGADVWTAPFVAVALGLALDVRP